MDKNSWPLGGVIGAVEKPEDFMEGAAEKVAEEMRRRVNALLGGVKPSAQMGF